MIIAKMLLNENSLNHQYLSMNAIEQKLKGA
jgi:hypothetical protein